MTTAKTKPDETDAKDAEAAAPDRHPALAADPRENASEDSKRIDLNDPN